MSTDVQALVEALRQIRDNRVKPGTAVDAPGPFCFGCDRYVIAGRGHNEWRPCGIAERALASWESRPRLSDDGGFRHIVFDGLVKAVCEFKSARGTEARRILDAIEVRLLGWPGKGTT